MDQWRTPFLPLINVGNLIWTSRNRGFDTILGPKKMIANKKENESKRMSILFNFLLQAEAYHNTVAKSVFEDPPANMVLFMRRVLMIWS